LKQHTLTLIYWMRLFLAIGVALVSAIVLKGFLGITFSILVYAASYLLLRFYYKVDTPENRRKILLEGIGAYFLVWLMAWILFYTLQAA